MPSRIVGSSSIATTLIGRLGCLDALGRGDGRVVGRGDDAVDLVALGGEQVGDRRCADCRSTSMSVMVWMSLTLPPVSSTAFSTPAIRRWVLESTLLPVRWTRLPSPPIASIAALRGLVGGGLDVGREAERRLVGVTGRAGGERGDLEALALEVGEGGVDVVGRDAEDAERVVALRGQRLEHVVLLGLVPAGGLVEGHVAEAELGLAPSAPACLPRLEVGVRAAGHERDLDLAAVLPLALSAWCRRPHAWRNPWRPGRGTGRWP